MSKWKSLVLTCISGRPYSNDDPEKEQVKYKYAIGDVILGANTGRPWGLSPVISVYPDNELENLQIEVILSEEKKKAITFRPPKIAIK